MPAEVCAGNWQQRGCQMTSQRVRAVHLHVMDLSRCKPRPGPSPSRPGMSAVIGMQLDQPVTELIRDTAARSYKAVGLRIATVNLASLPSKGMQPRRQASVSVRSMA